MKRRDFLKSAAIVAIAPGLQACETDDGAGGGEAAAKKAPLPTYSHEGELGPASLFSHGVASGDPTDSAVILWTRITVGELADKAPDKAEVFWEIAVDKAFKERAGAGLVSTDASRDWTVKVDATGLSASTQYHYRFYYLGRASTVGRAKTAPDKGVDAIRFGVCSCARYAAGYYVGYRGLAERADLDAVLHLGDYMYESDGGGGFRPNDPPHTTVTLSDYRRRYARQRTDEHLQAMHAAHPMIAVWDDHETANNAYRDGAGQGGHDDAKHGKWADRKAAGVQAWHEWMPIRDAADRRIWRKLAYGPLCDLVMLDTRLWGRDKQTTGGQKAVLADPKRSNMGMDQEQWLSEQITQSKARWVVLGQQVMCAPLVLGGVVLNTDQWDGYQASRKRLFESIDGRGKGSVVVLTGDIHSSWANEVIADPEGYTGGSGEAWAVEFVAPGITSSFPASIPKSLVEGGVKSNPHIRWFELGSRGYVVLTLKDGSAQGDWYLYKDITKKDTPVAFAAGWFAEHGSTALKQAKGAAS